MAILLPPQVHTYHCICTSLLLASTHTISSLPRRAAPSLDNAYILPIPSSPPSFSPSRSPSPPNAPEEDDTPMPDASSNEKANDMPPAGYTLLLGLSQDPKSVIVRREDGFEKRSLWRCGRCAVVVGYEILSVEGRSLLMDEEGEGWRGKVIYILANGILGTEAMVKGTKIEEGDVELEGEGVGVWE